MSKRNRKRYSAEFKAKVALAALTDTGKANRHDVSQETRIKELHEKIGQLTVERDFLARAFGR